MKNINELITLLEKEKSIYEDILTLLSAEQKNIIKHEIDKINEKTKQKENLLLQINYLEKERLKIVGDLTLDELINQLDNKEATILKRLREEFIVLINRIKKVNEENKELLQTELDYINFVLSLLTDTEIKKIYNIAGKIDTKKESIKFIDKKI